MVRRKDKAWKRFWSKVRRGPGCWEWTDIPRSNGYGLFWVDGKQVGSHRVAYEMGHGKIPQGMCVCHTCDNPRCVRPSHLFLGSARDNRRDAAQKNRVPKGREAAHRAKLTDKQIRSIRTDKRIERVIAKEYDINRSTVGSIKRRERYNYVT